MKFVTENYVVLDSNDFLGLLSALGKSSHLYKLMSSRELRDNIYNDDYDDYYVDSFFDEVQDIIQEACAWHYSKKENTYDVPIDVIEKVHERLYKLNKITKLGV
jgi:glycosylphosphatidylinositol transamidase (GPIT) subunit GPI8